MPRITDVMLMDQPQQQVLFIRERSAVEQLPNLIGQAFGEMGAWLGELGVLPADVPYVCFYNEDVLNLDVEIGFPVAATVSENGRMRVRTIPPRRVAMCMHLGGYGPPMEETYAYMSRWLQDNGLTPEGITIESYYNGPQCPEEQLLTRVLLPLK